MTQIITGPSTRHLQLEETPDLSGELQTVGITETGDKRFFNYRQTVGGILNANEQQRLDEDSTRRMGELHHAARVPLVLWLEWERLGITQDKKALKQAIEMHPECKVTNKRLI